jgi:uncharacterized protein YnzC (UPF0291/DUF896 family)
MLNDEIKKINFLKNKIKEKEIFWEEKKTSKPF